jgi:hypothetical protein
LSPKPDVVEGEGAEGKLCYEHRASGVKAFRNGSVLGRDAIAERFSSVGGADASRVEQVFRSPRNSMEWTTIVSCGDLHIGLAGLREGKIACQGNYAAELGIEVLKAIQVDVGEPLGAKLSLLDPAR